MSRLALVSAANDRYLELLEGMLGSLGGKLKEFDLKIIDLGLSPESVSRLKRFQERVEFAEPGWRRAVPGNHSTQQHKKVHVAKPYIPQIFPDYDGYLWVDADVWFQDPTALDDYVSAAVQAGAAFSFESHPMYRSIQKVRHFRVLGKLFIKGVKDYFFQKTLRMFGPTVALEVGYQQVLNSGIFFIAAGSEIWSAWQQTLEAADLKRHYKSTQISDQTCLQVALIRRKLPCGIVPATHNWLPGRAAPLFDTATGKLLDPMFPNVPIKAIHLVGFRSKGFRLPTRDGGHIETDLSWSAFQSVRAEFLAKSENNARAS